MLLNDGQDFDTVIFDALESPSCLLCEVFNGSNSVYVSAIDDALNDLVVHEYLYAVRMNHGRTEFDMCCYLAPGLECGLEILVR